MKLCNAWRLRPEPWGQDRWCGGAGKHRNDSRFDGHTKRPAAFGELALAFTQRR